MATGADLAAYNDVLKEHYTRDRVIDMTYRNNPLYAIIPKYMKFGGKLLPVPILYGNPQGRSKNFQKAQARGEQTSSLFKSFLLTRVKDYSIATIDNETMQASKGDPNSFLEAATTEIDGSINSLTRSLAINMYRDSSSQLGQISAEPAENATTFVVTILNAGDISNFEVGQILVLFAAKSGGIAKISETGTSTFEVLGVNRKSSDPTLTLAGTYDTNGTIAANDFLFVDGDRGIGISGLEDWCPATDPTSTPFFGVDRTSDITRLGGNRLDGTNGPIEEVLTEADAIVAANGGFALDHFFMSHNTFKNLKNALGSKVQYVDIGVTPRVSFRGVQVDGTRGPIKVIPDHNCPDNRVFGLQLEYQKFYSLGDPVQIISPDGLQMLRQASDDGAEVRHGSYSQYGVRAPGSMINIQL